jgi:hypothetical protein
MYARRRTALLRRQGESAAFSVSPTECSGSSLGVSGVIRRARAEINRNQSPTPATDPTSTSPTPPRLETSAGPWARTPSPSSRPAIALPAASKCQLHSSAALTAATGWKVTRPPRRTYGPISEGPTGAGGQHILLSLRFREDASLNQERPPFASGERMTPGSVRRETSGSSPLAGEPIPRPRGNRRVGPGSMISQPAGPAFRWGTDG